MVLPADDLTPMMSAAEALRKGARFVRLEFTSRRGTQASGGYVLTSTQHSATDTSYR
jgi:hypothetical protein